MSMRMQHGWAAILASVTMLGCGEGVATVAVAQVENPAAVIAAVEDLQTLAKYAAAADPDVALAARERLRAAGPAGVEAFLAVHRQALAEADAAAAAGPDALSWWQRAAQAGWLPATARQLHETLDWVCGQRDCFASELYWYTDLDAAKVAAKASGRPIVSLRLLGDLRDELSCANSRLFRSLLYPDPAVAALLRTRFVLHWSSERPAPRVTIDLGTGNSVVTTITGNSVHYVLDSSGRPVDALPGLMTPQQFVAGLQHAAEAVAATGALDGQARTTALHGYHDQRIAAIDAAWVAATGEIGAPPRRPRLVRPRGNRPAAGEVAPIAIGKMAIEAPLLAGMGAAVRPLPDAELWD